MKKKIEKIVWDSSFFNLKIGAINIEQSSNEIIVDNSFDVIYVKQSEDFPIEIQGFSNMFQETKLVFFKPIENTINTLTDVIDFDEFPLDNESLYELAYISGHHSRFLLDKNFGIEKFRALYRLWVDNSINKNFAKKIFYTKDKNIITGFVTYQEDKEVGKIGLIAILPNYQGAGLGKKLITTVEQYCKKNNIKTLEIPTQKENINACKFYTACGYSIKNKLIIKHYWNNDTI